MHRTIAWKLARAYAQMAQLDEDRHTRRSWLRNQRIALTSSEGAMPRISQFYGIIITMYYNEHNPPHLHARYAEHKAEYAIGDSMLLSGSLPRRAETLVLDWIAIHRSELQANWDLMQAQPPQPPRPVPPLP